MKILDLYITKVCNLNCDYCYVDVVTQESTVFPTQDFLQRVNLLDYDHIKFFGGEPLVKWDIIKKIVTSVREKDQKKLFTIVSNGILLSQDKIDFILENNVEVVLSLHKGGKPYIIKKIPTLLGLGRNLGIYIIFDPSDFTIALKDFLFFSSKGFINFCFAPEIYGDWTQQNILSLEKLLQHLMGYIQKHKIRIAGISHDRIKTLTRGCEKTVYDELGNFSPCNRFKALKDTEKFSYKPVYDSFDEEIDFSLDPDRWFYICPVGWYMDNEKKSLSQSIQSYRELNQVFVKFFREMYKDTTSFLSTGLEEIRFNLTEQCNLRCRYCYVDFKDKVLDYNVGRNIIDFYFSQPGENKKLSFFGGEPMLEYKLLEKLVVYAEMLGKKVSYTIATNFLLMTQERFDFLVKHNFDIHISLNGTKKNNDISRDMSSEILFRNFEKYLPSPREKDKVCILFALEPKDIKKVYENLEFIISLGFKKYNIELIFGKNILWDKNHIDTLLKAMKIMQDRHPEIIYLNSSSERKYLDIDTSGRAAENSLEFFGEKIDTTHKQYFDRQILKQVS